jgi:hypothetical protein
MGRTAVLAGAIKPKDIKGRDGLTRREQNLSEQRKQGGDDLHIDIR